MKPDWLQQAEAEIESLYGWDKARAVIEIIERHGKLLFADTSRMDRVEKMEITFYDHEKGDVKDLNRLSLDMLAGRKPKAPPLPPPAPPQPSCDTRTSKP